MTEAQAKVLRELVAGAKLFNRDWTFTAKPGERAKTVRYPTFEVLLRNGWLDDRGDRYSHHYVISDKGREALRQYEEGQR